MAEQSANLLASHNRRQLGLTKRTPKITNITQGLI